MGYDIDICPIYKDGSEGKSVEETSLTSNFYDLQEIKEGDQTIHIWSICDDVHCRSGHAVAERCDVALKIIKNKFGVDPGQPDLNNANWGWGSRSVREDEYTAEEKENIKRWGDGHITRPFPEKERWGVFAFFIHRFRDLGEKYPEYHFFSDHDNDHTPIMDEDDVYSDQIQSEGPITYYRHPTKGQFKVHNFETAMEIFGLLKAINDPNAPQWYNLAFKMPDAPAGSSMRETTNFQIALIRSQ